MKFRTTKKLKNRGNNALVIDKDEMPWVEGNKECIEKFPFLKGIPMHNVNPKARLGIFSCKKGTKMAEVILGSPPGTELPIYITDEEIISEDPVTGKKTIYYRAALMMDFFTSTKAKADE